MAKGLLANGGHYRARAYMSEVLANHWPHRSGSLQPAPIWWTKFGHVQMRAFSSGGVPLPYLRVGVVALKISSGIEGSCLRRKLAENRESLAQGLIEVGYDVLAGGGIVSVGLKDRELFRMLCLAFHAERVAFNPVMFPAIPRGEYRIRFCLSASHTMAQIGHAIDVASRVADSKGVAEAMKWGCSSNK